MLQIENVNEERPFARANKLAQRYGVSVETIKVWKRGGLLVFFQIRRVVRFDVKACDDSLRNNGLL
jgi:hypothetical protein